MYIFFISIDCNNFRSQVLCACSPVLETLLCGTVAASAVHPHPMLYFNDIPYEDMCALVEFMYRGSMTVTKDSLQVWPVSFFF